LTDVDVRAAVDAGRAKLARKFEVSAEFVLGELLTIAKLDLGDAYDASGNLKPVHEIPDHVRRAMAGLETDEIWAGKGEDRVLVGITKKVKFLDKIRALEALGRHLKLFTDKVIHSADDELLEALRESRKPVEA
jgi:phage terminase small subunit